MKREEGNQEEQFVHLARAQPPAAVSDELGELRQQDCGAYRGNDHEHRPTGLSEAGQVFEEARDRSNREIGDDRGGGQELKEQKRPPVVPDGLNPRPEQHPNGQRHVQRG